MRRLPPLKALCAFEAVARHQSFRKAADELGVTPTAISHQITLLESICKRQLFRRRPRPISLTPAGERLYPQLGRGFDLLGSALIHAQEEQGAFKISTTIAFAGHWLIPRLQSLRTAVPGHVLEVEATEDLANLRSGDIDLAIRYAHEPTDDLEWIELFRDHFVPVCSPRLEASNAPLVRPADLANYTLLHFRWKRADPLAPSWRRWLNLAQKTDIRVKSLSTEEGLWFSEESHAIDAAIAGHGIALCSDVVVRRYLETGKLVAPINVKLPGLGFFAVFPPNTGRRLVIDRFITWVRAEHDGA